MVIINWVQYLGPPGLFSFVFACAVFLIVCCCHLLVCTCFHLFHSHFWGSFFLTTCFHVFIFTCVFCAFIILCVHLFVVAVCSSLLNVCIVSSKNSAFPVLVQHADCYSTFGYYFCRPLHNKYSNSRKILLQEQKLRFGFFEP